MRVAPDEAGRGKKASSLSRPDSVIERVKVDEHGEAGLSIGKMLWIKILYSR